MSDGADFRRRLKRLPDTMAEWHDQKHVALYAPFTRRDVGNAWDCLARAFGCSPRDLAGYVDHEFENEGKLVRVLRVLRTLPPTPPKRTT